MSEEKAKVTQYRKAIADENYEIVKKNSQFIPSTCQVKTKSNIKGILKNKNIIEILNATTNQAIQHYLNENATYNIAVLNFANAERPGGGYLKGSPAQEEELCRTSPFLYASLDNGRQQGFYNSWGNKNWNSQMLYTPNSLFIRNDGLSSNNKYDFLNKSYNASVITSAAPDFRNITDPKQIPSDAEYENVIKQIYYTPIVLKDETVFTQLVQLGHITCTSKIDNKQVPLVDILILGAWGCGAFKFGNTFTRNNKTYTYSEYMAERFVSVLSNLGGHYKKICFAIPKSIDKTNYDIFNNAFISNQNNFASVKTISLQISSNVFFQGGGEGDDRDNYYNKYIKYKKKYLNLKQEN